MKQSVEYLTAETESGRQAVSEVMEHSYGADLDHVPARWTVARLVDGAPVAWIQVDPDRRMDFPGAAMRYGFIMNVATRTDRRHEGHFHGIMEHSLAALRTAHRAAVVTHGHYGLYRQFGFEVFTHHSGIFARPELIERKLGPADGVEARDLLAVEEHRAVRDDLLLINDVKVATLRDCRAALLAAAAIARERGKVMILIEHPAAPSYGSRYPMYHSPQTPLSDLALACGAEVRLQGADPESGSIPDADWIKVLDAAQFVREALAGGTKFGPALYKSAVSIATDAGAVSIESLGDKVVVSRGSKPAAAVVKWPSAALAQLVTGYRSAEILAAICNTDLAPNPLALLSAVFPPCWRFSRNESWTFSS